MTTHAGTAVPSARRPAARPRRACRSASPPTRSSIRPRFAPIADLKRGVAAGYEVLLAIDDRRRAVRRAAWARAVHPRRRRPARGVARRAPRWPSASACPPDTRLAVNVSAAGLRSLECATVLDGAGALDGVVLLVSEDAGEDDRRRRSSASRDAGGPSASTRPARATRRCGTCSTCGPTSCASARPSSPASTATRPRARSSRRSSSLAAAHRRARDRRRHPRPARALRAAAHGRPARAGPAVRRRRAAAMGAARRRRSPTRSAAPSPPVEPAETVAGPDRGAPAAAVGQLARRGRRRLPRGPAQRRHRARRRAARARSRWPSARRCCAASPTSGRSCASARRAR